MRSIILILYGFILFFIQSNFFLKFISASPLSSQVLSKAGKAVEKQCRDNPMYHSVHYRVTDGGNLPLKNIIHLSSPTKVEKLLPVFEIVLNLADEIMHLESLAIPAIFTGECPVNFLCIIFICQYITACRNVIEHWSMCHLQLFRVSPVTS